MLLRNWGLAFLPLGDLLAADVRLFCQGPARCFPRVEGMV